MSINKNTGSIYTSLESELKGLDVKAWAFWLKVHATFMATVVDEKPIKASAFADAWHAEYETRAASSVKSRLSLVNTLIKMGYDPSTFETLEHATEVAYPSKGSKAPTVESITKSVVDQVNALKTADAKALIKKLAADFGIKLA